MSASAEDANFLSVTFIFPTFPFLSHWSSQMLHSFELLYQVIYLLSPLFCLELGEYTPAHLPAHVSHGVFSFSSRAFFLPPRQSCSLQVISLSLPTTFLVDARCPSPHFSSPVPNYSASVCMVLFHGRQNDTLLPPLTEGGARRPSLRAVLDTGSPFV